MPIGYGCEPELAWIAPKQNGEIPVKRSGHSFTLKSSDAETAVYMFGGCDHKSPPGPTNELYRLDVTNGYTWSKLTSSQSDDEVPAPRWRHSAILFEKNIIIFGGFAAEKRMNDLWIFNTELKVWEQKYAQSFWEGLPQCRGAHSATLVGEKMYVFGGYGGNGFGRTDFNDLHALDLHSFKWQEIQSDGEKPEPRSGHQTCLVKEQLLVIGGWNSFKQFQDIFVFDLPTKTWSLLSIPLYSPICNHTCVSVAAVPHWKVFLFGGNSGDLAESGTAQGAYLNSTAVLDTGSMVWLNPPVKGELPKARADTAMVFDAHTNHLIFFGGWANRWYNDLHVLNASEIVGPPYSISSIEPKQGPITGNAKVKITGFNFTGQNATLRFAVAKGSVDVMGAVLSPTVLQATAPSFEKFGALTSEVRVSLSGGMYTNVSTSFQFHSVTAAPKSLAFGPCLIAALSDNCLAELPTTFIIQSRDKDDNPRDCGGDEFAITLKHCDDPQAEMEQVASILDKNDGTYVVTFTPSKAGKYEISVDFTGTFSGIAGPIRGSPFTAVFQPASDDNKAKCLPPLASQKDFDSPEVIRRVMATMNKRNGEFRRILVDLRKDIPSNDTDGLETLRKMKEIIRKLEVDKDINHLVLDQVRQLFFNIKKSGGHVDKELVEIESMEKLFVDVEKQIPVTEKRTQEPTRIFSEKTEEKIIAYEKMIAQKMETLKTLDFWSSKLEPDKGLEKIESYLVDWNMEMKKCEENTKLCSIFGFPQLMNESLRMMGLMHADADAMKTVWAIIKRAKAFFKATQDILFKEVDVNALQIEVQSALKELKKIPKGIQWSDAYTSILKECQAFDKTHPLIRCVSASYMRPRHWKRIMAHTGEFPTPDEDPEQRLSLILSKNLFNFSSDINEICYEAEKEQELELRLIELEALWAEVNWEMTPYNPGATEEDIVPLLKVSEENFELLETHQIDVQGMSASPYQSEFEPRVAKLQIGLSSINEVVLLLGDIQRSWSYLEPLFIQSEEVKKQLPELTSDFEDIDREVRQILKTAWKTLNVQDACTEPGLIKRLEVIVEKLELCKHRLKEFLDGRRRQFPRFYFMSEADLLDILSNGSHPDRIMPHCSKIYLATKTLTLVDRGPGERPVATSFVAGVGHEIVDFFEPPVLEGEAEIYLETIMRAMRLTLFKHIERSLVAYTEMPRVDWINFKDDTNKPMDAAQIILLAAGVHYVQEVERSFRSIQGGDKDALRNYNKMQEKQLEDLIKLTQSNISFAERQRVMVLITMDAHGRDIVANMIRAGVDEATHFQWQSQLKHYFSPAAGSFLKRDMTFRGANNARAQILICDAGIPYDYEYLGNGPRLVITPLTDRIYVTATQALNLQMGCAPAGPAGTGKTETTKDLANALGKVCYVFNCSPEMDFKSLGNIFKGLASSGSWGCFDEFNRLVPEVLSVCSVQFKAVCDACKADDEKFILENDEVMLDPTVGAFITMNPGYLGRSELPEGLKALFRPMTVMVPDLVLICENMLMAEGFTQAKILASKFYGLYSLLGQLLSKQLHYDWGLRAVKSVLCVAGAFKRAEPDIPETDLLMRALRDFNIPKIVAEDMVVFFGLLGDLFPRDSPNVDVRNDPPRKRDMELESMVQGASEAIGNTPRPEFMLKVVQLSELLAIRHCVFVMGPPASGKTETWKTLKKAREIMGTPMEVQDLNPKSVSTNELYGYIVLKTREWKDGLLSRIMRDLGSRRRDNGDEDNNPKWIILDGDLDANWIESMNSVMDDNRMLTLASNERIPLKVHMRMIFEIRDLVYATPATVSRAGILYISTSEGYQWRCLIDSWLDRHCQQPVDHRLRNMMFTPDTRAKFQGLFDQYVETTLRYFRKKLVPVVPVEETTLVTNLLNMIDCLLTPQVLEDYTVMQNTFVFCCVWSFGSILTMSDDGTDYSAEFSNWWKNQWKDVKLVASASNTVFDFWLDPETSKFNSWSKSPYFYTETYVSPSPINQITVPTTETASIAFWLENLISKNVPVMVCGPAGTGKTQNIMGMLKKLSKDEATAAFRYCTINFNFYTTSAILQQTMFGQLERKTGINLGPPGKAKLIYFMDDLNLPEVDPYNTQSAISLLRQVMEYKHWFDRVKLQTQNILNTQVVSGMNPTAGSFLVDPRLQRHFCTFAMGMPEAPSLVTIYETFLGGHLSGFADELSNSQFSNALIKAALSLHASVVSTFRKTAANFHYEFNVRHLSNVFQGLIASKKDRFNSQEKFVLLWLHESERVYGDRLVCKADIEKYNQLVQMQVKKSFASCNTSRYYAAENSWPLIFCHFTKDGDSEYDQIMGTNLDDLKMNLQVQLREYNNNENNTAMQLDLFDDAVKHVARIVRILRNESGHALLVGVGGSGKRSLARLASHICGCTVRQITISSKYGENEFKEDLRKMHMAVVEMLSRNEEDGGVVFMLTDSQITNEKFLIYLNDLLASGEIPDLFAMEDMDNIVNLLSPVAGTKDRKEVIKFFQAEIRKRLHLCLCFSPVGDDFRNRARKFPALVNCTVIDWFQPWPKEALLSVGREKLKEIGDLLGSEESRAGIEKFMPFSFQSVNICAERFFQVERRHVYTTPKSYLELLQLYKKILRKKVEEYAAAIDRLEKGLQKLKETGDTVSRLEVELKVILEAAEDKKAVASGIAEAVNKEKANVETESKKAGDEAAKCAIIQTEVTEKQRSTQEDLAKAEPAVEQAMAALDSLNKKDLGECKTMSKPPAGVDDVFSATMVLLAGVHPNVQVTKTGKVKDVKWDTVKKQLLGNIPEYIEYLVGFKQVVDDGKVPPMNWKEVRVFLEMEHFNYDTILTKNKAAAGLCSWVINIVMYYDIVITVEPKRQALAAANLELEAANARLSEVTALVADLQAKLDKLLAEAAAAEKEKEDAINAVETGNRKMKLAGTLTNDLSSENVRWGINVLQLQKEKDLLVGDVLLASAFISYIGPFTKPFRDELINKHWVPYLRTAAGGESIAMSEEANPLLILTDDAQIAQWNTQKLPSDRVSTENGAIVVTTVSMGRRPLIVDPQLQAIAWIREMEAHNNLIIVRVGQKMWIERLKTAIGTDGAFLIENLGEKIDPILAPVIQRSTSRRGARYEIQIGDASVPYNDNFHLYLHTKLGNPHYPPEIQAECTIVNFTVTMLGLEDQLLNLTVSKERQDLAIKREKLIQEQNNGKIELKKLEDDILFYLASADDDITNNQPLIQILSDTKHKAQRTQNNMEAAKKTQESVNITSEKYRSIAARGSLLFFLMNDISKVHSYYIYSLASFQQVFLSGIYRAPPAKYLVANEADGGTEGDAASAAETPTEGGESGEAGEEEAEETEPAVPDLTDEEMKERCQVLMDSITSCVYNYVRRGLFERNKLTVATMLCLKILLKDGLLNDSEVEYFLISKAHPDAGNAGSASEWLPAAIWAKLKALESLKAFQGLGDAIQNDPDEWRKWFATEDAERQKVPGDFIKLTAFQRLILLRAMRPDRVTNALRTFILESLGEEYVTQPPFNMEATYAETNSSIPIFFVLFPGVDPTPWVETLGKANGVSLENNNFINISMGQGQEAYAGDALKRLSTEGGWIILQNVHLMQSWLPTLERQLEEVATEGAHDLFRCFISAEPPPLPDMLNIPESLLQSCIKVANEAPSDIQSNLRRAWANFGEDKVLACTKPAEFKACLFALCWFHAIVLGRRRFGQQGWSRAYSFNTGDLTICANILHSYLDNNVSVPWDDLRYLFGEIMYGGHITDAWDRRTNNTYLAVLIDPGLLNGMELGPGFKSPNPQEFSFADYANYIEKNMVPEAPPLFGLHPNAEIGYLTTTCETLCYTIVTIGGGAGGGGGGDEGGGDKTAALRASIDDLESRCPEFFNMLDVVEAATPHLTEEHGPFVVVALQECSRMNVLLQEIRLSLGDLKKGLNGQLNMSQAMEDLATAMSLNEVPGRNPFSQCKWEKKAWPSTKSLSGWFADMVKRYEQLVMWAGDTTGGGGNCFVTPFSMWLPGLFNPTAYTTACLQVTSRKRFMPLNQMTVETHVTTIQDPSTVSCYPDDGVFVHGLILEGARWSTLDEINERYPVGATPPTECGGTLLDSNPKELLWSMPVIYVKAVTTSPTWEPSSVGYLRHDPNIYECPVYLTRFRGHTYIFLATLPTDCGSAKWVLRGVALIFQDDN
ncbi:Dynein alpha chain, flagellar outer arm [Phytophthora cactorum]|uniref:Dynein alpha chain, flagellar outer arm n=1 Tax=Phytophthora cactorum TaxID=29920 RepID=A0A329S826_9STRA|nr:Dynein alpha chain, flagellar outer arm [Phytophthora cactorum]KAG2823835.1 Dynein alpha chain, flagellar outer arm [Phytophthora cactorum]KAG2840372.1 Dynein alpha chain, flagellar outer arm [Phytophthora cactorum]KAG2864206.1 Dynein alpha chain, flagellar outer arm [Phytophthora cactorum]KAG2922503.1 Dynein alpha chain, flagellar outer arm [Phytophthora cactorum]